MVLPSERSLKSNPAVIIWFIPDPGMNQPEIIYKNVATTKRWKEVQPSKKLEL